MVIDAQAIYFVMYCRSTNQLSVLLAECWAANQILTVC